AARHQAEIRRDIEPAPGRKLDTVLVLVFRPVGVEVMRRRAEGEYIVKIELAEQADAEDIDVLGINALRNPRSLHAAGPGRGIAIEKVAADMGIRLVEVDVA